MTRGEDSHQAHKKRHYAKISRPVRFCSFRSRKNSLKELSFRAFPLVLLLNNIKLDYPQPKLSYPSSIRPNKSQRPRNNGKKD